MELLSITTEIHPWEYYIPNNCNCLVIGTFPTAKSNWSFEFFYPNKRNRFWKILEQLANEQFVYNTGNLAVTERKILLDKLKIGVTDMGFKINRSNGSSLDEKLTVIEHTDILDLLKNNPTINRLVFTSSSGKESAWRWFRNYLKEKGLSNNYKLGKRPYTFLMDINGKKVSIVIAYSPSPRAANRISMEKLVELYREGFNL